MESSAKSRSNHYQTLGVAPAASNAEIQDAFKAKVSLFRTDPLGSAAQICIAYETLRDPIKRREYDRSLGLGAEEPKASLAAVQPRWAPFIASPRFNPGGERAATTAACSTPPIKTEQKAEAPVDPRVAAIAATLRELARPIDPGALSGADVRQPSTRREPQADASATLDADRGSLPHLELPAARDRFSAFERSGTVRPALQQPADDGGLEELARQIEELGRAEKKSVPNTEHRSFPWKRPAVAATSLLVGAVVFGTLAGVSVKENEGPGVADASVRAPAAAHHPKIAALSSAPVAIPTEMERQPQAPAHASIFKARRTAIRPRAPTLLEEPVAITQPAKGEVVENSGDQPAKEPAQPLPATLPLPGKVIARTIQRIGYSCGEVATATAVGDPGSRVFEVTCTSGQTFKATPLGGRYHFRKVAGR